MNTRQQKESATENQFDEWTKALAEGLSRRKTLQLLGGGVSGLLLALSGPKGRAATTVPPRRPGGPDPRWGERLQPALRAPGAQPEGLPGLPGGLPVRAVVRAPV